MGEERPREKSRLKTHSNLKEEVISDLNSGTMMSMITMSRGPEGLSSLSDQDLHMVTEGLYERMKKIRDHVKDTHRDISRNEERVTRGFLADTLFDTLNSMDSLFMDKNLWRTILGGGDKAEDFVEEMIGLSTLMEYTQEHGGTPG